MPSKLVYNIGTLNRNSVYHAGTNQCVVSPVTNNLFNITTNFSMSAWVMPNNFVNNRFILSNTTSTNIAIANGYTIYINTIPKAAFQVNTFGTGSIGASSTAILGLNTWYHIMGVYNGVDARVYLNGVLGDVITNGTGIVNTNSSATYQTGRLAAGTSSLNHFIGYIDEVSIWNIALTPSDAVKIYNGGRPLNLLTETNKNNLQSWWRMGEDDTYPIIRDASNRGSVSGTMTNMTADNITSNTVRRL